eukprot:5466944-Pyramimonas_sp.AAC.1
MYEPKTRNPKTRARRCGGYRWRPCTTAFAARRVTLWTTAPPLSSTTRCCSQRWRRRRSCCG